MIIAAFEAARCSTFPCFPFVRKSPDEVNQRRSSLLGPFSPLLELAPLVEEAVWPSSSASSHHHALHFNLSLLRGRIITYSLSALVLRIWLKTRRFQAGRAMCLSQLQRKGRGNASMRRVYFLHSPLYARRDYITSDPAPCWALSEGSLRLSFFCSSSCPRLRCSTAWEGERIFLGRAFE